MKNKCFLVLLVFFIWLMILFISTSIAETNTETINACKNNLDYSQECYKYVLDGTIKITYDLFGAVGDGITNDYEAIKNAHDFANNIYLNYGKLITVYSSENESIAKNKSYFIGDDIIRDDGGNVIVEFQNSNEVAKRYGSILVYTNVDWQGANFIIDDYIKCNGIDCYKKSTNSVDYTDALFKIDSLFELKNDLGLQYIEYNLNNNNELKNLLNDFNKNTNNIKSVVDYVLNDENISNLTKELLSSAKRWQITVIGVDDENYKKVYVRPSSSNPGHVPYEDILVDTETGDIKSPIEYDYSDQYGGLATIRIFPIPEFTREVKNGNFITLTNNDGYITRRGIGIYYNGNIELSNIVHYLNEDANFSISDYENSSSGMGKGNYYQGFISIYNSSFININNTNLMPHTYLKGGTYDLIIDDTININIENMSYSCGDNSNTEECYYEGMLHVYDTDNDKTKRWGVVGTNRCRNVTINNSNLNRWDQHEGVYNLSIMHTTIGALGINLDGNGYFYGDDITFDRTKYALALSDGYGAFFDGDIVLVNSKWITPVDVDDRNNPINNAVFIKAINRENVDFGIKTFFPNMYVNNLIIDATYSSNKNFHLMRFYDSLTADIGNMQTDPKAYYFRENAYFNNISLEKENSNIKLFPSMFGTNPESYNIIHYGGYNKYNIYYNNIIYPGTETNNQFDNSMDIGDSNKFIVESNNNIDDIIDTKELEVQLYFDNIETINNLYSDNKSLVNNIEISDGIILEKFSRGRLNYTINPEGSKFTLLFLLDSGAYVEEWNHENSFEYIIDDLELNDNSFDVEVTNIWGEVKTYTFTISPFNYLKGDMNNDGKIDLTDVIQLLKKYLEIVASSDDDIQRGDINNDGAIGLQDVILILRIYLGID